MSTTEPIQIPIEGEASDFIADAKKVQAEMDAMSAKLKAAGVSQSAYNKAVANSKAAMKEAAAATVQTTSAVKQSSISITDLRSAYMIAADAARVAGQVWQATGQEFVNYAEQVKNLSRNIGASAEETSRLIQVADDVRISYESLNVAMKVAQKDGIEMSVESLARLSDEYNKLAPGVERTQFLLDKFGKSGLEMGKLMEQGGDKIRKMSAEIDGSLVLTEEAIKASDDYQKAVDNLNDSMDALKIQIGNELIPTVTKLTEGLNNGLNVYKKFYVEVIKGDKSIGDFNDELRDSGATFDIWGWHLAESDGGIKELTTSLDDNSDALGDNKDAIKAADDALKDYQDALKAVSEENLDNESTSRKIADDRKQYEEEHKKALEEQAEAQRELAAAESEWREAGEANQRLREDVTFAQHDLNDAIAKYGENSDEAAKARRKLDDAMAATSEGDVKIAEAQAAYDETTKSLQALEIESMKARDSMIYDMIATKLAVDGLTDSELKALDAYAVSKGIKSQADVDETNRRIEEANAVVEGIKASEDVMVEDKKIAEETKRLETAISTEEAIAASEQQAASMGVVKEAVDSATLSYQAMAKAAWDAAAAAQSAAGSSSTSTGASSGGLSPDERGSSSSTTMNKSSTFNISIHNPVGDNSANSIRRTLKQTSYLGFPA